eukprot:Hpha_TRINITY_DN16103_c2_g2::TRINITY_DN16103_c2_g2_i1::g.7549::m.7549
MSSIVPHFATSFTHSPLFSASPSHCLLVISSSFISVDFNARPPYPLQYIITNLISSLEAVPLLREAHGGLEVILRVLCPPFPFLFFHFPTIHSPPKRKMPYLV